ncbi:unnamed protein product [Prorocentrum cordatum]|uniref:Major facilitator superfamily (MFS) profile domain-containing protein n=1 Tax=Prorocentrum cordatum TaxID=2364126 RepID=A0ABN9VVC8_9DINO|nr:unnamed protein product [Polarella glacialis]
MPSSRNDSRVQHVPQVNVLIVRMRSTLERRARMTRVSRMPARTHSLGNVCLVFDFSGSLWGPPRVHRGKVRGPLTLLEVSVGAPLRAQAQMDRKCAWIWFASVLSSLGAFLFGLDIGYIAPILECASFKRDVAHLRDWGDPGSAISSSEAASHRCTS